MDDEPTSSDEPEPELATDAELAAGGDTVRTVAKQVEDAAGRARVAGGILLLVTSALVTVGVIGVGYVAVQVRDLVRDAVAENREREAADRFGRQVILCVLEELDAHRASSQRHIEQAAAAFGLPAPPEMRPSATERAPDVRDKLAASCTPVLTELRRNGGHVP